VNRRYLLFTGGERLVRRARAAGAPAGA